jgi:vitamin B12 transporter
VTTVPKRSLLVLWSCLSLPASLTAQKIQRDTVALPDLVVTAERTATPLSKSIATTTVIKGDDLRAQGIYFVEDALKQVPGAMPVSTGSFGGISSLFLRGGESDYTKVLIDGVAVNQPGGAYNFGTLSTDNIERIEIVRGPVSVLYGSDAVSGVIQIFTRRGVPGITANAASQAGTFGTWTGTVGAAGGQGPVTFSGSLSRYQSDGIYDFNSDYASTVGSGAVTFRPDNKSHLTLTLRRDDNTLHFPTDFAGAVVDSNQKSSLAATTLGLDLGRRLSEGIELRAHLDSRREVTGSSDLPDSPGDSLGFYFRNSGRMLRRTAGLSATVDLGSGMRLVTGAEGVWEALLEGASGAFDTTRSNYGVYGQGLIEPDDRSVINFGMRLDDNEKFGSHLTVRAGAAYRVTPTLRARGSAGTSFKEPSLRENYAQSLFERGNPDLDPEEARSWELGLEQSVLNGTGSIAVNYFDQKFRDLIQYDGAAAPDQPTYRNVAKTTARGVEVLAQARPVPQLTLGASYTYLHTNVDDAGLAPAGDDDIFVEGKPLVRRPGHSARFDAHGTVDRLSLGAGLNYVGKRDDVDFAVFPQVRTTLPSYVTVDADAAVDIIRRSSGRPGLTATFRGENLFDKSYQTVVGFAAPGRLLLVGARVEW